MKFSVNSKLKPADWKGDCLVLPCGPGSPGNGLAAEVDTLSGGLLSALSKSGDFRGEPGQTLLLHRPPGLQAVRLLLVGIGPSPEASTAKGAPAALNAVQFQSLANSIFTALGRLPVKRAAIALDGVPCEQSTAWQLRKLGWSAVYSAYRYDTTLSKPSPPPDLKELVMVISGRVGAAERRAPEEGGGIALGCNLARELGNLPPNHCTPRALAAQARSMAKKRKNIKVKILDEKKLAELGMGALLAVSAGSAEPPRLIVLEYHGLPAKRKKSPVVLVGKGVTFDTGGISLKPSAAMDEMKFDMCGAASVFGTVLAADEMALPIDLVGIIGAVENMPGSRATRPGDIVKAMSGRSIEVLNTDAEGRLVLCDALHYARRYKPQSIVDIATLTGACVVALGTHASGLLGNHQPLMDELLEAGMSAADRAWQLPLWEEYHKGLKSNFADVANIGGGREAGTITAACFLEGFVDGLHWAHLDIAGTAWHSGMKKSATGRPVPLLSEFLRRRAGLGD